MPVNEATNEKNRAMPAAGAGKVAGADGKGEVEPAMGDASSANGKAGPEVGPDTSSAARTMPMPKVSPGDAALTKPMPRVPGGEDTARTVPIPNVVADSGDVISNAVRAAAAEAMTMRMPAVEVDTAPHGTPTEPLPVLREDISDQNAGFGEPGSDAVAGPGDSEVSRAGSADSAELASEAPGASGPSLVGSAGAESASDASPPRAADDAALADSASDRDSSADDSAEAPSSDLAKSSDPAKSSELSKPSVLADAPTVSFRSMSSTELVLPETVAEVVAVVDAASKAIAAAEDAARLVAEATAAEVVAPPTELDLREPAPPAPVDGVLDLLAPVLERPLLVVEQPALPPAPDLMALHRVEFEVEFAELPVVAAGDEPPIPTRFGPGLAVLPHIEFPV